MGSDIAAGGASEGAFPAGSAARRRGWAGGESATPGALGGARGLAQCAGPGVLRGRRQGGRPSEHAAFDARVGAIGADLGRHPRSARQWLIRYQDRVLFGSDNPVILPDRWIAEFDKLPMKPEVRPMILKENAIRLLGLKGGKA